MERKAIQWRQLCAIARVVIEAEPTIDDSEWKARTKDLAAAQGYDSLPPLMLTKALTAVEHVLEKQWGPRPPPFPSVPAAQSTASAPPPIRTDRRGSQPWMSLKEIIANLKPSAPSRASLETSHENSEIDAAEESQLRSDRP